MYADDIAHFPVYDTDTSENEVEGDDEAEYNERSHASRAPVTDRSFIVQNSNTDDEAAFHPDTIPSTKLSSQYDSKDMEETDDEEEMDNPEGLMMGRLTTMSSDREDIQIIY